MKRSLAFLATLLLFAAAPGAAQIGSDNLKLKTGGGLGGDASRALGVEVYRGTTAPTSPETGGLWCDTSSTPCTMKMYDGDSWESIAPSAYITTQADAATMPATPSDGQLVYIRACRCLWVYDDTLGEWVRQEVSTGRPTVGADLSEEFTATVITAPSAAPTVTAAAGGSATNGSHTCAFTYANATGGETTLSPTTTVTITAGNNTYSWSSVTAGGTGTSTRRLYCSKAGTTTPLYWQGEIGDNSTTTASVTLADGSFRGLSPTTNFSGAVPAGWTVVNGDASGSGSGGCGSTGTSLICVSPRATIYGMSTNDPLLRIYKDISTYKDVAYRMDWRILNIGRGSGVWDTWPYDLGLGGAKYGSTAGNITYQVKMNTDDPLGTTNTPCVGAYYRTSNGGSPGALGCQPVVPHTSTWAPFTITYWSSGTPNYRSQFYFGFDAEGPTNCLYTCSGVNVTTYGTNYFNATYPPSYFELALTSGQNDLAAVEIDSWRLTQQ